MLGPVICAVLLPFAQPNAHCARASCVDVTPPARAQKAWDIAKGPIKSVPMNLFMMWMAGNTVHIFSLMMVFMLVMNPVKNLGNVSAGTWQRRHCLGCVLCLLRAANSLHTRTHMQR